MRSSYVREASPACCDNSRTRSPFHVSTVRSFHFCFYEYRCRSDSNSQQQSRDASQKPGLSKIAAAKAGQKANQAPSKARARQSSQRRTQKAFAETLPCDQACAQAQESPVSVEESIVKTCQAGGEATLCAVALCRRKESSAHAEAPPLKR
jgi:hypothetical protein